MKDASIDDGLTIPSSHAVSVAFTDAGAACTSESAGGDRNLDARGVSSAPAYACIVVTSYTGLGQTPGCYSTAGVAFPLVLHQ